MKKYMYVVTLKLDEANIRECRRLQSSSDGDGHIKHCEHGWYNVWVVANSTEDAIVKAKQRLAEYKNVRVEEFFENTSHPEAWSIDSYLVCPECHKQYRGWKARSLQYYVCPHCRRRCTFEKDKDKTESREFALHLSGMLEQKRIL